MKTNYVYQGLISSNANFHNINQKNEKSPDGEPFASKEHNSVVLFIPHLT